MREGAPEGFTVVADEQTLGRGRLDRTWQSPPGAGLAMSLVLRPVAPESSWGWVPLLSGLAVVEALRAQGVACLGATASGGEPPEHFDLRAPTAFVVGHETQGLDPALKLADSVTLPMQAGESLNVAMAGTALLFEAARQRRTGGEA